MEEDVKIRIREEFDVSKRRLEAAKLLFEKGIVQESGGTKLGDGCFMIPTENLENITKILKQHNIQPKTTKIYKQSKPTEKY